MNEEERRGKSNMEKEKEVKQISKIRRMRKGRKTRINDEKSREE